MKILVAHSRYRSGTPSGENRVVDQECAALAAAGHDVARFERDSDDIASWPLMRKAILPAETIWSRESRRGMSATLQQYRPDVVHIHNTFPLLSPSVLYACRDAGVPAVVTIHNYRLACTSGDFFRRGAVCHDCVKGPLVQGVLHGCYRSSRIASVPAALAIRANRPVWQSLVSAYIFISAAQRDLLTSLDFDTERTFVVHNLVPQPLVEGTEQQAFVLYAGRLEETKGLRVLMSAWDRYRNGSPASGMRLVIVGAGGLADEVAEWAESQPSVDFSGQVSAERCAELVSQARAVIVPSAWEETFGLVVVEAMALGVPAIASSHGSFVELINDGVDGVLFPPGDSAALTRAIAEVAENPTLYARYGTQARKSYEVRFNPAERLDRMLQIYRFAIANPVCSPGRSQRREARSQAVQ
jgi:glycosyltransferase involved in cell wall biosynthesis